MPRVITTRLQARLELISSGWWRQFIYIDGTLVANMIACVISACQSAEFRSYYDYAILTYKCEYPIALLLPYIYSGYDIWYLPQREISDIGHACSFMQLWLFSCEKFRAYLMRHEQFHALFLAAIR